MMEFHRLSEIFPLMEEDEFKALVLDIKFNGLREQITLFEGKILDGRNRYRACIETNIEPVFWNFDGDERSAERYVVSLNLHRRHLSKEDRTAVIKKIIESDPTISSRKLAKEIGVGKDTVRRARELLEDERMAHLRHQSPVEPDPGYNIRARKPRYDKVVIPPGEYDPPPPDFPRSHLVDFDTPIFKLEKTFIGQVNNRLQDICDALGTSELEREMCWSLPRLIRTLDKLIEDAQNWKKKLLTPKVVELRRIK